MNSKSLPGILLAAGISKRFGAEKLLALLPTGETLFERSLRIHQQSKRLSPLIIVISRSLFKIINNNEHPLSRSVIRVNKGIDIWHNFESQWGQGRIIVNDMFKQGISRSIQVGLMCLKNSEKTGGLLFSLADLPFLTTKTINFFIRLFQEQKKGILFPVFNGINGHPLIIDISKYKNDIKKIKGDRGLRTIIKKYPQDCRGVPWTNNSVTWDIDTPGDLKPLSLSEKYSKG